MNRVVLVFFANFETPQFPPKITFLNKIIFSSVLQQLKVFGITYVFG